MDTKETQCPDLYREIRIDDKYRSYSKSIIVLPRGRPIFDESAITVEITDDAGGPYVVIYRDEIKDGICIDADMWPPLLDAINKMLAVCRDLDAEGE